MMKTFYWLLKRELWENKGMFVWLPVVLTTMLTLVFGASFFSEFSHTLNMNAGATPALQHRAITLFIALHMFYALPILLAMGIVTAFYCSSALYSDHKNGSIGLWRSLPISDSLMVWSKVAFAVGIAPLITIICILSGGIVLGLVMCAIGAALDFNLLYDVFWHSTVLRVPLQTLVMWMTFVFWALPSIGWFLVVSALSKRAPLVWAIALPLVFAAAISAFNKLQNIDGGLVWLRDEVITRITLGTIPGSWMYGWVRQSPNKIEPPGSESLDAILQLNWQLAYSKSFWVGAGVGVALILLAIRVRRWRT
jgi:ABC-2 type transport system permease protein